jgi:hypothetical protein
VLRNGLILWIMSSMPFGPPGVLPSRSPDSPRLGPALVRADALLRLGLGLAWVASGWWGVEPALRLEPLAAGAARTLLAACGLLSLAGVLTRTSTALGLALSGLLIPGDAALAPWLALVAAAAARLVLHRGPSASWLDRTLRRRSELRIDLLATELCRAQARGARDASARSQALGRAGDAYERAGRALASLALAGLDERATARVIRVFGRGVASLLGAAPWLRDRIAAALLESGTRRDALSESADEQMEPPAAV